MSLRRSVKRFLLASAVAIGGLTVFHRYVGHRSTTEAVSEATTQYIGFLKWASRRFDLVG